jgi:hypothetical protein
VNKLILHGIPLPVPEDIPTKTRTQAKEYKFEK